jgi:hypothetical protein
MKRLLLVLLAASAECLAATTIEVTAKFADVPAGVEVPEKPELLAKTKGIDILSAPRVTTAPSQAATIEVTQNLAAPDGSVVPLGITLTITPTLTEKGNIAFKGKATDRFKHGQREQEALSVLAFVAREIHFKGVTTSGSTVLLKGGPATTAAAKKDPSVQVKNRELVIYLTFKKVTTDPEKKKPATPAKTTKSSGTKSSTSKSSTKKKSSTP